MEGVKGVGSAHEPRQPVTREPTKALQHEQAKAPHTGGAFWDEENRQSAEPTGVWRSLSNSGKRLQIRDSAISTRSSNRRCNDRWPRQCRRCNGG
jgi:hypothetical protein